MSQDPRIDEVLDFWFGELREDGTPEPDISARWWKKDPDFDARIRERFGELHREAALGQLDDWAETPRGAVALVVVLDQFSRNLNRDDPRAFENDDAALAVARDAISGGMHEDLVDAHRYMLLMPFMHSEDPDIQDESIAHFEAGVQMASTDGTRKLFEGGLDYAKRHAKIVRRFGRYPHRNEVLGRESTDEEIEFLKQPGSSF